MKLRDKFPGDFRNRRYNQRRRDNAGQSERGSRNGITFHYPFGIKEEDFNNSCSSFVLLFTKMKPWMVGAEFPPYGKGKKEVLKRLSKYYEDHVLHSCFIKSYLSKLHKLYKKAGFESIKACLDDEKKMIIGMGSENSLENSLALHHIYGFPYIPATAVKGVLRYIALVEKFGYDPGKLEEMDKELSRLDVMEKNVDETLKELARIFGTQRSKGAVVFADALPDHENLPKFDLDILNPHYSSYYNELYSDGGNISWDEKYERENPVPVFFPVVKSGCFVFYYKIVRGDGNIKKQVVKLFESAFKEGFGAKTRYGYGILSKRSS